MVNKNFLFKFLTLFMVLAATLCLTACGGQGGKEAWDLYVSGVEKQDATKLAKSLYYNQNEIDRFVNGDGQKYFNSVGIVQTVSFKTTVECDFSNEKKIEVYYASEVTAKVDGQQYKFILYSYKTNNGTFLCSLPNYNSSDAGFGNEPTSTWYEKAYYTEDAFLYQTVPSKNGDETTITISKQNKNQKNVVIPAEIDGMKVTTIDAYAFYQYTKILSFTTKNSKMKTLELPEGLLLIDKYAFYQCGNLKELNVPNSVKDIKAYAFSSCVDLTKITLNADDTSLYETETPIQSSTTQTGDEAIVITGGKEIYAGDMLTLSASALGIPQQDIQWSSNSDLITIETDAVNNAKIYAKKSGANVTVTASYKQNPNIKATIKLVIKTVPALKTIDASAFNRCSGLNDFYITALNPNSIVLTSGTTFALSSDVTIWVPAGTKTLYQYHASWSKFANQIKEIGETA